MSLYNTGNPFALLGGRKIRDGAREKKEKEPKAAQPVKKDDKKPAPKAAKPVVKKESKTISLVNEQAKAQEKAIVKADKVEAKVAKVEKSKTDRHDRSGRGSHARKEGKGTGGWDDNKPTVEEADVDPDAEKKEKPKKKESDDSKTEEQKAEEAALAAEEAAEREREEKQMTLEEYKEKLAKEGPVAGSLNIRTVDDSGFKGMVAKKAAVEEGIFQIGGKNKKVVVKKVEKKDKVQIDVGFRTENPTRQREGKGKGKGKGEGKGRGGGRGGYSAGAEKAAPQVDDEELFPALGGAPAAAE